MRIITNEKLVQRNKRIATWLFFISLAILFGGFFLANGQLLGIEALEQIDPEFYVTVMPFVLIIGFTATLVSVRMTNLWVRQPRPEDAIQFGLKGISNKSALYNYFHFPARHVLICPQGVFAIVTRFQEGKFSVKGDKWRTKRSFIGQFFSIFRADGILNPTREAEDARDFIQYIVEDYDPNIKVQPIILFVDPRVEVEIEDPTIPVLYADPKRTPNLKDFVRDFGKSEILSDPKELAAFIDEFEAATLTDAVESS